MILPTYQPPEPEPMALCNARKIICVGFMKTGTSSLAAYLTSLGLKIMHDHPRDSQIYQDGFLKDFLYGYDGCANMYAPFFQEMDAHYPNSKFILTTRHSEKWWRSLKDWGFPTANEGIDALGYRDLFGCVRPSKRQAIARMNNHNLLVKHHFCLREDDLLVLDVDQNNKAEAVSSFLNLPVLEYPHEKSVGNEYSG